MAFLALSPSVFAAHCADQLAGLEVVGGESRVGGVDRVERRVEHDHLQARVARLLDRRDDRRRVARHDGEALGAGRDQVLDRGHLAVVVAVILAGGGAELDAELLRLLLCAFAHLDEERIGLRLGDETDDVGGKRKSGADGGERDRGDRAKSDRTEFREQASPPLTRPSAIDGVRSRTESGPARPAPRYLKCAATRLEYAPNC